ncbi:Fic family protein [Streptomyces sp. NPDC094038]|uniref:Fic family protein n=1 Tax=Streptomyces sp. NPDC094038 TaxID=3366055 RepID=UPI00380480EE
MKSVLWPFDLSWDEVDPARHPFDHEAAARAVRSLGPARCVPSPPDVSRVDPAMSSWSHHEGNLWATAMSYALMERYGRWAVGWRWAHDEGDFDGGPVGSWCCPRDSITTPEATLDRVVAALREWRAWLESLAGRFDAYPLAPDAVDDQRILWERAARNLILQVVDRTGCGSGWYGHCRQVLGWFLDRWGVAPGNARALVDEAVGGRFHSWVAPDGVVVDDIAERLARSLPPSGAPSAPAGPAVDHLARWLAVRGTVAWREASDRGGEGPVTPARDGAAEDIHAFDRPLDPARADGLLAALERLRADAAHDAPLDFALLQGWQQHVLGTARPPAFRTTPAFAKHGRERYGIAPDTRARLDACLAESTRGVESAGSAGSAEGPEDVGSVEDAGGAGSVAGAGNTEGTGRPGNTGGTEKAGDVGSAEGAGVPLPLTARAARAYLDVCFFHPFDDGNARSAFLALVYVLAREGVALGSVSLLRRVTFRADDPRDAVALTNYTDLHLAETRRQAAAPAG